MRDGDYGVPNDKAGYRSCFQRSLGSASSILMTEYLSGSFEETACRVFTFDFGIGPCTWCGGLGND